MSDAAEIKDVFVIGGGINGCGIARDAVGRGYSVTLAEMNDLASATSSASTKLFHGGLRYLEYFEFRLVREALKEREVLLRTMPHISWPMRFVLPFNKEMRFESTTPTSRLLSVLMPWMKGRRPGWLIRLGLFLYDNLGGREILPGTRSLNLKTASVGAPLQDKFVKAFEYSDCWVQDARLVVLNARDAQERGATILPRHKVVGAAFDDGVWSVTVESADGQTTTHLARMLVNAGGPWVEDVLNQKLRQNSSSKIRLVRGSHIITKRLYDHDKCYFFQGEDGRIIFSIPYEEDFTLIGTTDADHDNPSQKPECTDEEAEYLVEFANAYFTKPISLEDVVWRYSGVRPLYDEGADNATAATRDYVLKLSDSGAGPILNVFGGKITTYRKLAESALEHIDTVFDKKTAGWTGSAHLPGGDFKVNGVEKLQEEIAAKYPFLEQKLIKRLVRHYGTDVFQMFGSAELVDDLGKDLGNGLFEAELRWAIQKEWVKEAQDFLWRRTKLGLRMSPEQVAEIEAYCAANQG